MQPPDPVQVTSPGKCRVGEEVAMTVSKKVAKSGAITLPRQIRQEVGIFPGTPVDIEQDDNGVHIRKHIPVCHFCGRCLRD